MEALHQEFKEQGLVILAISDEESDKVEPFITEHEFSYPILLDPGRKVHDLFEVAGIPKSFLYDRDGHLIAQAIDEHAGSFWRCWRKPDLSSAINLSDGASSNLGGGFSSESHMLILIGALQVSVCPLTYVRDTIRWAHFVAHALLRAAFTLV